MSDVQRPLGTPYGPFTTAEEAAGDIDLSGKIAIVTGGASNLGRETVRVLASRGADVIVPARDFDAARLALAGIPRVTIETMNLIDPVSVDMFADTFLAAHAQLDLLVLSAGVMATPLFRDAQGHEGQFATNHLGHFHLTMALWPALGAGTETRVVVLSSRGHQLGGLDLDDLDFVRRPYDKWLAYGQSKTANALFALALDRRGRAQGIRAYSVHPGSILGPLARHLSAEELALFDAVNGDGTPVIDPARDMKTPQQGAATIVWCATAPELDQIGGVYCENCDIASVESEAPFGIRPFAIDPEIAESLWRTSAQITGHDVQPSFAAKGDHP